MAPTIKSLVWATDIDVMARDRTVERRDGYWVVQSPGNPTFWWGNFLLFDDAPGPGDGERWEQLFDLEFRDRLEVTHRALAWDRVDGQPGAAEQELVVRGYGIEWTAGLVARADAIRPSVRASRDVEVRRLDPASGADEDLWQQVIEVQLAQAPDEHDPGYHLTFLRRRQQELRDVFTGGDRGGWYVALLGGAVVGSLGIVVTGGRARYQTVDTVAAHRREGIARRLIADAARDAAARDPLEHLVIAADPDYHAIGIYESLGFQRLELVAGALRQPARL